MPYFRRLVQNKTALCDLGGVFAIFRNLSDIDIQHITKKMQVSCIFGENAERGAELAPNKHQVGAGVPLQGAE